MAASAVLGRVWERAEEGEERRRVRERGREVRGTTIESQGVEGERQAGGGRGTCARTVATRPPAHWKDVEDDREEPLVGWAGFARGLLQCQARWALLGKCQVSSLSFSLFLFSILLFCSGLY